MAKQCVHWKPIGVKNVRGSDCSIEFPAELDIWYRGKLLSAILNMEKKRPLSFERAAQMAWLKTSEAFKSGRIGQQPGECNWYSKNFVEWVASEGYHIELTGDEFEPYVVSDKAA